MMSSSANTHAMKVCVGTQSAPSVSSSEAEALTGASFRLWISKPTGTSSTRSTTTSSNHAVPRFSSP